MEICIIPHEWQDIFLNTPALKQYTVKWYTMLDPEIGPIRDSNMFCSSNESILFAEIIITEIWKDVSVRWHQNAASTLEKKMFQYHTRFFVYRAKFVVKYLCFIYVQTCTVMWCTSLHVSTAILVAFNKHILPFIFGEEKYHDLISPFAFHKVKDSFLKADEGIWS